MPESEAHSVTTLYPTDQKAHITLFLVTIINQSYPTNGIHLISLIRCLCNVLFGDHNK